MKYLRFIYFHHWKREMRRLDWYTQTKKEYLTSYISAGVSDTGSTLNMIMYSYQYMHSYSKNKIFVNFIIEI